jgi:hypothetical protein
MIDTIVLLNVAEMWATPADVLCEPSSSACPTVTLSSYFFVTAPF